MAQSSLLADELYLLAHDEQGRPRTPERAVDLGLAAALLGELVLRGHVHIERGRLSLMDGALPADALAKTVLEQLVGHRQCRGLRIWLALLAGWSFESVGERLERQGHVTRTKKRRGRPTRYVPVDHLIVETPVVRLRLQLTRGLPEPGWNDDSVLDDPLLMGLTFGSGLAGWLLHDKPSSCLQFLAEIVSALPPELYELVADLHEAVGSSVDGGELPAMPEQGTSLVMLRAWQ
jgi:hypothetical protein